MTDLELHIATNTLTDSDKAYLFSILMNLPTIDGIKGEPKQQNLPLFENNGYSSDEGHPNWNDMIPINNY